jgi:uncharacterized FlgJ-related protein
MSISDYNLYKSDKKIKKNIVQPNKVDSIEITSDEINLIIKKYEKDEINKKNLLNLLIELKIQHPYIVLKQAILESGGFNSKLFKSGKNLFGMRKPSQRKTFALRKKICGYASFNSWAHGVADYKLWQGNKQIGSDYYKYLIRRGYAADMGYIKKLKAIQI